MSRCNFSILNPVKETATQKVLVMRHENDFHGHPDFLLWKKQLSPHNRSTHTHICHTDRQICIDACIDIMQVALD